MHDTLLAVSYTRVSKDRSSRRKSVTEQDREADDAARENRWRIPDDARFTDNDRSASRFARRVRVGWEALLEYLRAQPVDVLILWEVSRADRRLGPWISLLDLCRERRIRIHVVKDGDTYAPWESRDRRYLAMEGIDAEGESERTSKRILRDKRAAALEGRPAGTLPYGYLRRYDERGHYLAQEEHPEQAAIVRRIADEILAGKALKRIAEDLNAEGIPSPRGGRWLGFSIRQLILKPTFAGLRVHGGQVIGAAAWPALIDEPTWRRIKAKLEAPERRHAQDSRLQYQLSGAGRCGLCGEKLRTLRRRSYWCPKCTRVTAPIAAVDSTINRLVRARFRLPGAEQLLAPTRDDDALAAAEKHEQALRDRLDEHYRLSGQGKLSAMGLVAVEAEVLPLLEAASARVRRLSASADFEELDGVDIAEAWPGLRVALRRNIIARIADVRLGPAGGKGVRFTRMRLGGSRWIGADRTWAEVWAEEG